MIPRINRDPNSALASLVFIAGFWFHLPFFFSWMYFCNGGEAMWMASVSIMILILYHVTDWRLATLGLVFGALLAWFLFKLVGPVVPPISTEQLAVNSVVIAFSVFTAFLLGFLSANGRQIQLQLTHARETQKALQALAGSIAHEVRNSFSQIKYSLDTLGQALPAPTVSVQAQTVSAAQLDTMYQHLAQGQNAVQRGLQVIDMTLDEVSAKPLTSSNFVYLSAAQATQKAVDEYGYENAAERGKVQVVVKNDFTFKGHETSYLYVLFNLIKNALYYFKLHPQATLTLTVDSPCITVTDTGPGMPPQVLAQVFQAFKTSGKSEGTGLGLAYCQRVMQALGGSIRCDSVLGEYTTFTLEFVPVTAAELEAHQAQVLQNAQSALRGKRLLLVDDSAAQRASTRQLLAALPCQLDEADNGQAALAQLQHTHYDLLLMDLQMPVLDGYATTAQIRAGAVPAARCVPIVAYSSESAAVASVKTRQAGMNGFVSKPSDTLTLIASVQQAMVQAAQQPDNNRDTAPDPALLRGKTLLVADDVDLNRQVVATYVQPWGMQVLEACHGMQVLEILVEQGQPVDLVLLDMQMPGLSGPRTAELLRQQNNLKSLPIVALTGYGDEASRQTAQAAGMNDFISKPIEPAVLQATLLRHLASRAANDEAQCRPAAVATAANPKAAAVPLPQTRDALADWAAQENSTTPRPYIEREDIDIATLPLLDIQRLGGFKQRAPEFVAEMWADYAPTVPLALQDLRTALDNHNHADLHRVLHALVGNSGNAGAWALHRFLKCRVAPDVEHGHWPREEHWLETLADLHARTEEAMRQYLA